MNVSNIVMLCDGKLNDVDRKLSLELSWIHLFEAVVVVVVDAAGLCEIRAAFLCALVSFS